MKAFSTVATALAAGIAIAGCTVHQTEAPALSGPSGLAQVVTLSATPDTITQNGSSQSVIVVSVRGPNGEPVSGQQLRVDTLVNGTATNFGTLSSRTVTTGSNGTANVVFTSPAAPPNGAVFGSCSPSLFSPTLPGGCVTVAATQIANGFTGGTQTSTVDIHLVPLEVIPVPGAPTADFTISPPTNKVETDFFFNASGSLAASGKTIVEYKWDFGDGVPNKFGANTSHDYAAPGTYFVTLTVTDNTGIKASTTKSLTVTSS